MVLSIKDLSLELGQKKLFRGLNLKINSTDKVGLVGSNGSGKSSLLKCIIGQIEPDFGKVELAGSSAYLAQETHKVSEISMGQLGHDLSIEEYLILHCNLDVESWEISKLINQMNMDGHSPSSKLSQLSGGQKVKVEIIKLLIEKPDLLILDEPTNFLDIPTAQWLMKYLMSYEKAILVVSHDLRLMNKALTRIWFLNELKKNVTVYNGNYDLFLRSAAAQEEWLIRKIKSEEKKAKAKAASAAVISSRTSTKEKMKGARKRAEAEKMKEEVEEMKKELKKVKRMQLKFEIKHQSSRNVLKVQSISKSYGQPVLKDISFDLTRSERMVILGKNGAGKTTLLKILSGQIEADDGSFKWGHNVDFGYYAQEYEGLDYNQTLIENIQSDPRIEEKGYEYSRRVLGSFLFTGTDVEKPVYVLSGGEKTRLAMAKIIAGGYNTLLLDEPTTYLDPQSIQILLDSLMDYKGTVILVSHEPEFVAKFKPDKALLMPEEKFTYYSDEYLDRVGIIQ